MSTITLSGAYIRHAGFAQQNGGSLIKRVHFTANLTKAVCEAMEWQTEMPECVDSAKLSGSLNATRILLTPKDDKLAKHEIQLECTQVSDFELVYVQEKDRESRRLELRFQAIVADAIAIGTAEEYAQKCGKAPATLKINYSEQQTLPIKEGEEDEPKGSAKSAKA
jgi:hypothetical protein